MLGNISIVLRVRALFTVRESWACTVEKLRQYRIKFVREYRLWGDYACLLLMLLKEI